MPQRIQRKRTAGWRMPEGAVYVGRPSRWGNPFQPIGRELVGAGNAWRIDCGTADNALRESVSLFRDIASGFWNPNRVEPLDDAHYRALMAQLKIWRQRIGGHPLEMAWAELRGHDLACWCPLVDADGNHVPCHADVLLDLAAKGGI